MKVHKQVVMCCITQTSYVAVVAEVVAGGTPKSFIYTKCEGFLIPVFLMSLWSLWRQ